jgi:uncharacterized membrane protein (UPF0127 family)
VKRRLGLLLLIAACHAACESKGTASASTEEFVVFPPGATVDEVEKAVDGRPDKKEGIHTPGHGSIYFVVIRDGERHGAAYRQGAFHVVIGAGITLPEGALSIRRIWTASGQIDGQNEEPQRWGISVAVEPGAPKPYSKKILEAAATFCEARARRVPLHPDCVLAMGEIPYTNPHPADGAEKELAKAAREHVPSPPPDRHIVIRTGGKEILVDVEIREDDGIRVGMMFRRRFEGENRGMLFVYPHASYHNFWMRNCPIPIDVAYVNGTRIEEIHEMTPGFGVEQRNLPKYDANAPLNVALEMPGGWFAAHGVKPGDEVVTGS